jgi:His/Glu/Gln/Arg/opine family amino acid ABC transporter permease subunit
MVVARWPIRRLGVLAIATLLLSGCGGGGYYWAWYVVMPTTAEGKVNFFYMVAGFQLTIELAGLALIFGVLIGLVLAVLGRSPSRILRTFVRSYVSCVRAIPTFVLLLWIYYALPVMVQSLPSEVQTLPGIYAMTHLTPLSAATMTLALSAGAFLSEMLSPKCSERESRVFLVAMSRQLCL